MSNEKCCIELPKRSHHINLINNAFAIGLNSYRVINHVRTNTGMVYADTSIQTMSMPRSLLHPSRKQVRALECEKGAGGDGARFAVDADAGKGVWHPPLVQSVGLTVVYGKKMRYEARRYCISNE